MRRRGTVSRLGWLSAGVALAAAVGALAFARTSVALDAFAPTLYTPMTPCRLVDTRPAPETVGPRSAPLAANDTYTVDAYPPAGGCPIPTSATALQLNVTAVGATAGTFLTIWPSDAPRPTASSLNPAPGQGPVPNAVTTALSPQGRFSIFNLAGSVNVIVDVVGYFGDATATIQQALANAAPKVIFSPGTATSIPANQCIDVLATGGALAATDAGKVVTGYITDSGGVNPPPSINNATVFKAGVVFKTIQGGAIGFVEVCNPTTQDKALPAGWKLIFSVKA